MKNILNALWLTTIFALLFISQSFATDVSVGASAETINAEQLVAKNVTSSAPVWCGDEHLVVDIDVAAEETYPLIVDLLGKNTKKISSPRNLAATSCSPDGKWLLLIKIDASDKEFWRFNLETEQKELFAIGYGGIWSPDGKKVLFTAKQSGRKKSIPQPEPKWDFYWAHEWPAGTGGAVAWLNDSESLILANSGKFYYQRRDELLPLHLTIPNDWELSISVIGIKADQHGGIHALIKAANKMEPASMKSRSRRLAKCVLDDHHIQIICDELTASDEEVGEFDISRDGKQLVYIDMKSSCLSQITLGAGKKRCLVRNVSGNVSISPNGQRITFSRDREKGKSHGYSFYARDLFVIQSK